MNLSTFRQKLSALVTRLEKLVENVTIHVHGYMEETIMDPNLPSDKRYKPLSKKWAYWKEYLSGLRPMERVSRSDYWGKVTAHPDMASGSHKLLFTGALKDSLSIKKTQPVPGGFRADILVRPLPTYHSYLPGGRDIKTTDVIELLRSQGREIVPWKSELHEAIKETIKEEFHDAVHGV